MRAEELLRKMQGVYDNFYGKPFDERDLRSVLDDLNEDIVSISGLGRISPEYLEARKLLINLDRCYDSAVRKKLF